MATLTSGHRGKFFIVKPLVLTHFNPRLFRCCAALAARKLSPVDGLHLPVELAQWSKHDLVNQRLNRFAVLGGVIQEDARDCKS